MADDADIAGDRAELELAARTAAIRADIPAGAAGECDDCGEAMPRLVGGRCGFCRDGRRPPLTTYDRLDQAPVSKPVATSELTYMPKNVPAPISRKISVAGRAMRAVELRAAENSISYQQAADELITLAADGQFRECTAAGAVQVIAADLSAVETEQLLDELSNRFAAADRALGLESDLTEMTGRAIAAETKLAAVTAALGGAA